MHLILHNATILTQNPLQPSAEAIAVRDGKIEAVGSNKDILSLKTSETRCINLRGKTLLPGFNDAHIHIWKVGNLLTFMLDVRGLKSKAAMLEKIATYAQNNREAKWLMVRGFNEALWEDGAMPTRFDLDTIGETRPIVVIRTCAHIAVVNSATLAAAKIDTTTAVPEGGEIRRNKEGVLTGIFTETALGLVMEHFPAYSAKAYEMMIRAAQKEFLRYGITSATDPAVMPDLLAVYRRMEAKKQLKVRINAVPVQVPDGATEALPLPEAFQSDFLVVDTVKFFSDGGLSGKTAAMRLPYRNTTDEFGVLRLTYDFFLPLARRAQAAGFKIATHAIGDLAIDTVLKVYKDIFLENKKNIQHRIEHFALPSEQNLADMKTMKTHAVPQAVFLYELGKNFRNYLPDSYLENCYPLKKILDAGINIALSSDAPVVKDFNPWVGIQAAVERRDKEEGIVIAPEQGISVEQALYAYTMGGALAQNIDHERGSLAVGKRADMIVISENPLKIEKEKIGEIKVLKTFVGGKKS